MTPDAVDMGKGHHDKLFTTTKRKRSELEAETYPVCVLTNL